MFSKLGFNAKAQRRKELRDLCGFSDASHREALLIFYFKNTKNRRFQMICIFEIKNEQPLAALRRAIRKSRAFALKIVWLRPEAALWLCAFVSNEY